jgi:hypothetical protein
LLAMLCDVDGHAERDAADPAIFAETDVQGHPTWSLRPHHS